ncbi:biotin/lipoyl-containing protein [uncultured Sulfitobacter sp.]|uniref:acetyl-CoA carboxylase biotin carboxyl carrier protein n=1 Tax=uncultured Sulfitobacter sp. TaxID=191468 RepID=UPI002624D643|nr:biotin/lipoyl-containing protein [uncultured Sulfitobacter sp.]
MTNTDLTHEDICKILELVNSADNLEEFDLTVGDTRIRLGRNALGAMETSVASATPATPAPKVEAGQPADAAPEPAPESSPTSKAPQVAQPTAARPAEIEIPEGQIAIRAPMMGVFYRFPEPGQPPYVEVDSKVSEDGTLCLLEIMKLFTPVSAGVKGTVRKIVPENAELVEFDQILFLVEPD